MDKDYGRGQLEWAVWNAFRRQRSTAPIDLPAVFRTRIKRLLEIDLELGAGAGKAAVSSAFYGSVPRGTGSEARFDQFGAFCIALGIELLDAGFKQREVVFLLRHVKPELSREFAHVLSLPPSPRNLIRPEDRPGAPTRRVRNLKVADCLVYMLIEKVELTEAFPAQRGGRRREPSLMEPRFIRGSEALANELSEMPSYYRKILVIEIAELIVEIGEALIEAPIKKRGRKKNRY